MSALFSPGSVIADRYRIDVLLGRGGMGAVYRARHLLMDRDVALKVLHPTLSDSEEARNRFLREARWSARIRHRHVVEVYDVGMHEGAPFMVMEVLEGESLECALAAGTLSTRRSLELVLQAMQGVLVAHEHGIVHRDIKAENIFVARQPQAPSGLAKVLDFGISKLLKHAEETPNITKTGSTMGTPAYMSLEQMTDAKEIDHRTDVYSFGVLLYRALTGKLPFDGESLGAIAVQVVTNRPLAPSKLRPELPVELDAIVLKAMAVSREDRYQDLGELIAALQPLMADPEQLAATAEPVQSSSAVPPGGSAVSPASDSLFRLPALARRRWLPLVAGGALIAGAAASLVLYRSPPAAPPSLPVPAPLSATAAHGASITGASAYEPPAAPASVEGEPAASAPPAAAPAAALEPAAASTTDASVSQSPRASLPSAAAIKRRRPAAPAAPTSPDTPGRLASEKSAGHSSTLPVERPVGAQQVGAMEQSPSLGPESEEQRKALSGRRALGSLRRDQL